MGLLNALILSAHRFKDELLPACYAEREVRWVVNIDPTGAHPAAISNIRQRRIVPDRPPSRTGGGVGASLLVDKPSYALGIANKSKRGDPVVIARREHDAFLSLVQCAATETEERAVQFLADWLSDPSKTSEVKEQLNSAKPEDLIAFQIGSEPWLTDLAAVKAFWSKCSEDSFSSGEPRSCCACGAVKPAVRIMPTPVRLFNRAVPITSFNESAFCSHGATKSSAFNAPLCFACATTAAAVLQHLVQLNDETQGDSANAGRHAVVIARDKEGREPTRNCLAIFWTKEAAVLETDTGAKALDELPRLALGDLKGISNGGVPAYASQLRNLLKAPWKGGPAPDAISTNRFYLAALSPSKGRLIVREWLETDAAPIRESIDRYVSGLEIVHPDGRGAWFPPLYAILAALESPTSSRLASREKSRLPQVEPQLLRQLIRCIFTEAPPPMALLVRAVRCFRVPEPAAAGPEQPERQMLRRMALAAAMKLVLTHQMSPQERKAMTERFTTHDAESNYKDRAPYLCGCLLAVLEAIQARPGNSINTTLVDRFYGSASTAPAAVFANLINMATKAHLPRLRRENKETFTLRGGEKVNITDILTACCDAIDSAGGFPMTLAPEEQAQFALGFYHQRAELSLPRWPLTKTLNKTGE